MCTYYHVPPLPDELDEPVPIGQVCANAESLVVDETDRPVSRGEVGELLIRGPTLMRGYWERPNLNKQAFVWHPIFDDYEDVFYRTGDLVQLHPDGNYRFLGRKDRQIKTRGYRVELDEIEVAILSHEQVEETAVFTIPDGEGSHKIEAAAIMKQGSAITPADLTRHIAKQLPVYAIPGRVVFVDKFPRTSSGKIDRRKLQIELS